MLPAADFHRASANNLSVEYFEMSSSHERMATFKSLKLLFRDSLSPLLAHKGLWLVKMLSKVKMFYTFHAMPGIDAWLAQRYQNLRNASNRKRSSYSLSNRKHPAGLKVVEILPPLNCMKRLNW
jgi:hypothetical protein